MGEDERLTGVCPYCGDTLILGGSDTAAQICNCDGAKHERLRMQKWQKLRAAIESICGEGCDEYYPTHKPINEEDLTAVLGVAEMIASQIIHTATLMLRDGTTLKITMTKVERKASSQRCETI